MNADEAWESLDAPWRRCLELAWSAYGANTIPVGAAVVDGSETVVATGRNGVYDTDGPKLAYSRLAHAEVNALSGLDPEKRYDDHVIYSSLEPCLLCAGAAVMTNVGTIRYAGADPYAGAAHVLATNPHIDRLRFSMQGPLAGGFGLLAAALHAEFYLRRKPDGAVVRAHRERAPQILEVAVSLQGADAVGRAQRGEGLREALASMWPLLE